MPASSSVAVEIERGNNELDTMEAEERDDSVDVGGDWEVVGSAGLGSGDSICCGTARAVTVARGLLVIPTSEDADGARARWPNWLPDAWGPFDFVAVTFGGWIRMEETTLFLVGIKFADVWDEAGSESMAMGFARGEVGDVGEGSSRVWCALNLIPSGLVAEFVPLVCSVFERTGCRSRFPDKGLEGEELGSGDKRRELGDSP